MARKFGILVHFRQFLKMSIMSPKLTHMSPENYSMGQITVYFEVLGHTLHVRTIKWRSGIFNLLKLAYGHDDPWNGHFQPFNLDLKLAISIPQNQIFPNILTFSDVSRASLSVETYTSSPSIPEVWVLTIGAHDPWFETRNWSEPAILSHRTTQKYFFKKILEASSMGRI